MTDADDRAIAQELRELAIVTKHPANAQWSTEKLRRYVERLRDLPAPAVLAALERCGKIHDWFPSVAEIRREVGHHAADPAEIAESAWVEVWQEVRRVGYNRPRVFQNGAFQDRPEPQFSSVLIQQAVDTVGWARLCTGKIDDVRLDFIFAYRNLRERAVSQIQRGEFMPTDPALDEPAVRALPRKGAAA